MNHTLVWTESISVNSDKYTYKTDGFGTCYDKTWGWDRFVHTLLPRDDREETKARRVADRSQWTDRTIGGTHRALSRKAELATAAET